MSNVVKFGGANLPSPQSLSSALRSIEADVGSVGTVIIKMDTHRPLGIWRGSNGGGERYVVGG